MPGGLIAGEDYNMVRHTDGLKEAGMSCTDSGEKASSIRANFKCISVVFSVVFPSDKTRRCPGLDRCKNLVTSPLTIFLF